MPYCHQCGTQINADLNACPACGASRQTRPQSATATRQLVAPAPAPLDKGTLLGGARWEMVRLLKRTSDRTTYLGIERMEVPCAGCRKVSPADALFCEQCGAPLVAAKAVLLVEANGSDLVRERELARMGLQLPGLVKLRAVETGVGVASGATGELATRKLQPGAAGPARACAVYDPLFPGLAADGLPDVAPLVARAPLPVAEAIGLLGTVAAALDELQRRGLLVAGLRPQHVVVVSGKGAALFCADRIVPRADLPDKEAAEARPAAALGRLLAAVTPAQAPASLRRLWEDAQAGRFQGGAGELLEATRGLLAAPPDSLQIAAAQRSDVGRVREHNEDSLIVLALDQVHNSAVLALRLYAVADGMGGHAAGEVASKLAINALMRGIQEQLQAALADAPTLPAVDLTRILRDATAQAAREVHDQARRRRSDMGTTLVAALVNPAARRLHVVNVGDSRLYLMSEGTLRQVTRDHSLAQLLIERNGMDPETAHRQPGSNQIFRTLGGPPNVDIDTFEVALAPGDRFLLCSDGLNSMISDEVIKRALTLAPAPDKACDTLVRLANEAGGDDNITVIVGFAVSE